MDCNDGDSAVKPGATENCTDGKDNNCNNLIDAQDPRAESCPDAPVCTDEDGDGFATEGGQCGPMDCDDRDSDVNPGESEDCSDSVDNNCDGNTDTVDSACQARDDDDSDDEEEEHRRHDDDESRDSRRSRRSSRDRD